MKNLLLTFVAIFLFILTVWVKSILDLFDHIIFIMWFFNQILLFWVISNLHKERMYVPADQGTQKETKETKSKFFKKSVSDLMDLKK